MNLNLTVTSIQQKPSKISKESIHCGSKSDFCKKNHDQNYATVVVQIRPTSNEICRNFYKMLEISKNVFIFKPRVICTYKVMYYFLYLWMFLYRWAVLVAASQKKPVLTLKMENGFFYKTKSLNPLFNTFLHQIYTSVKNMASFRQTMLS